MIEEKAQVLPEWLQAMAVLSLKPGDIICLKMKLRLTTTGAEKAKEQVNILTRKAGLKDIQVIILEDGCDIGVLRAEQQ